MDLNQSNYIEQISPITLSFIEVNGQQKVYTKDMDLPYQSSIILDFSTINNSREVITQYS